jgi:hypothetical protein
MNPEKTPKLENNVDANENMTVKAVAMVFSG